MEESVVECMRSVRESPWKKDAFKRLNQAVRQEQARGWQVDAQLAEQVVSTCISQGLHTSEEDLLLAALETLHSLSGAFLTRKLLNEAEIVSSCTKILRENAVGGAKEESNPVSECVAICKDLSLSRKGSEELLKQCTVQELVRHALVGRERETRGQVVRTLQQIVTVQSLRKRVLETSPMTVQLLCTCLQEEADDGINLVAVDTMSRLVPARQLGPDEEEQEAQGGRFFGKGDVMAILVEAVPGKSEELQKSLLELISKIASSVHLEDRLVSETSAVETVLGILTACKRLTSFPEQPHPIEYEAWHFLDLLSETGEFLQKGCEELLCACIDELEQGMEQHTARKPIRVHVMTILQHLASKPEYRLRMGTEEMVHCLVNCVKNLEMEELRLAALIVLERLACSFKSAENLVLLDVVSECLYALADDSSRTSLCPKLRAVAFGTIELLSVPPESAVYLLRADVLGLCFRTAKRERGPFKARTMRIIFNLIDGFGTTRDHLNGYEISEDLLHKIIQLSKRTSHNPIEKESRLLAVQTLHAFARHGVGIAAMFQESVDSLCFDALNMNDDQWWNSMPSTDSLESLALGILLCMLASGRKHVHHDFRHRLRAVLHNLSGTAFDAMATYGLQLLQRNLSTPQSPEMNDPLISLLVGSVI